MTTERDAPGRTPATGRRATRLVALAALAGAAAGLAWFYGMGGLPGKRAGAAECRAAVAAAQRLAPLMTGELAALAPASEPRLMPDLAFADPTGKPTRLSDLRGRWVLVNLWATWCVPCRKEMPALDELQARFGGERFEVVAINIDTRNVERARAFLDEIQVTKLAFYADHSAKVFQDLKAVGRAVGMPTTLLVDPAGCEVGYLPGPAEWASEDAFKLVSAALGS